MAAPIVLPKRQLFDNCYRREAPAPAVKSPSGERTMRFIASDETVDRYGDIIRAEGWDLENYKINPVLLFAHNSREPAIGTVEAWVEGTSLLADATFAPEGKSAFADEIWNLVDANILRAVSVGFLPTKAPNEIKDPETNEWTGGYEFIAQELLELSVVPVPANPQAIAVARSLASPATISRLFTYDARASAHVAAEHRRRSIHLSRLRAG